MKKIYSIFHYLDRHKYLITIVLGLILITVVDENSLRKYAIHCLRINELQEEIDAYEQQFTRDSIRLKNLTDDPKGVERIARERYFMKRPNEEIFIMSIDQKAQQEKEEKQK